MPKAAASLPHSEGAAHAKPQPSDATYNQEVVGSGRRCFLEGVGECFRGELMTGQMKSSIWRATRQMISLVLAAVAGAFYYNGFAEARFGGIGFLFFVAACACSPFRSK